MTVFPVSLGSPSQACLNFITIFVGTALKGLLKGQFKQNRIKIFSLQNQEFLNILFNIIPLQRHRYQFLIFYIQINTTFIDLSSYILEVLSYPKMNLKS